MRANYDQLTEFCVIGRELRQDFDNDPEPPRHPRETKAYFEHVRDCIFCRRARRKILRISYPYLFKKEGK